MTPSRHATSRRSFLGRVAMLPAVCASLPLATAAAVTPIKRVGGSHLKTSLNAYSSDVIKDPFVLEFLDLSERHTWLERDLEQAIIDRIEDFLLELGKGFCFSARQKRLTLDGDHFYVDLVFYNRSFAASSSWTSSSES